jgi:hypothetical protein
VLVTAGLATALARQHGAGRPGPPPATGPVDASVAAATRPAPAPPASPRPTTTLADPGWEAVAGAPGLTRHDADTGVVLRVDPALVQVALVPGTAEPAPGFPSGGAVPAERRSVLLAATNAGFKRHDAGGGEMIDGRTVGALVPGAASLVVRRDGSVDIGAWGQDTGPSPDNVDVLQNLSLLVDRGQPAAALDKDILARWGATYRPQLPVAVWRSGLGVDAKGRLLYGAGVNVVPAQLAALLVQAGAVRAMELDINHKWVFGALFTHPGPTADAVLGSRLLAGMGPDPAHVLRPGERDFIALYAR